MTGEFDVVRHPRARRTKLSFDPLTGRARLTLPPRASVERAVAWARGQQAWLARQRDAMPQPRPFVAGATIPVEGAELLVIHDAGASRLPVMAGGCLTVGGPADMVERRVAAWLKRRALAVLEEETNHYAARAGVSVARVGIGDPRGRWGSCAHDGTIRYSWRLILAPVEVRRATVAHEVAHRLHMDHSPAFHAAVERLFGRDPRPERTWLRTHGAALHWFGRSVSRGG
ncbi:M48 family metallopeptidase [Sphingomonas adhaesiva]|uniref:M48 family metallopeptidase n=1 Tax=Sphingomonas adhaesiva TaxID=28212 RepID=UPI002FF6FF2E